MAKKDAKKGTCFIISAIGGEESFVRKRADQVRDHLIKPAAKMHGYEAVRADEESRPGLITLDVLESLQEAPIVFADLTGGNPNVYYELAVRHMMHKPVITLIDRNERLPFDISMVRTIFFDYRFIDDMSDAKERLMQQISEIDSGGKFDNPASFAFDWIKRKSSPESTDQMVAELIKEVESLKARQANNEIRPFAPPSLSLDSYISSGPRIKWDEFASFLGPNTIKPSIVDIEFAKRASEQIRPAVKDESSDEQKKPNDE